MLALAEKVPKINAPEMSKNCILVTPCRLRPLATEPQEHSREPYTA